MGIQIFQRMKLYFYDATKKFEKIFIKNTSVVQNTTYHTNDDFYFLCLLDYSIYIYFKEVLKHIFVSANLQNDK